MCKHKSYYDTAPCGDCAAEEIAERDLNTELFTALSQWYRGGPEKQLEAVLKVLRRADVSTPGKG
jgi:hypothetical protein